MISSSHLPTRFDLPPRSRYKSIGGYGVIGNTRTAALVGYDGAVDWCCLPKFDSPSVFAAILDRKVGGRWCIAPRGKGRASQRYVENTNILQTEFEVNSSTVVVTDFMPIALSSEAWSTPPEIHRVVECTQGEMTMRMQLQPRFDYGRASPRMEKSAVGVSMKNAKHEMVLSSSIDVDLSRDGIAWKEFKVGRGEKAVFVLSYGEDEPRTVGEYRTPVQLLRTEAFWKHWVGRLEYDGAWRDAVIRSALTLKLLVYSPTGAMVAAPTTSLPEALGGERNWDYRFSWIRDSAHSLWAFNLLGYRSEAERYLHWLVDNNPALDLDLRLMYAIDGHSQIAEKTMKHLEGYKGSGPVRIGNAAVRQLQLDAYGYMVDALYFSSKHGANVSEEMFYRFVKPLAKYICENWRRPSNGIWEIRNLRGHFVYTKAWCYAGLDRAVRIAGIKGHLEDIGSWRKTMEEIKREVLSEGWNERKKAFRMSYGSDSLDSANLIIPLIKFLSPKDARVISTIDAIRKELGEGVLLRRYSARDGLKGREGAFIICSFWLVASLAYIGRVSEARDIFEKLLAYSNHLGLYSEEVDPKTRELLGNFPQAFSHMGLIMAAYALVKHREKE
ncbi:MAG: glycoside hydrolase family 15 protein [Thaumarchaeota archaeon]|nr:glycoside hydrolase family 15 protein [Nitrososphaerota archaeon]